MNVQTNTNSFRQRMLLQCTSKVVSSSILGLLLVLNSNNAFSKGEITQVKTHKEQATASSYIENGISYQWGTGQDLLIDGFVYQNNYYDYQMLADRVSVQRSDNSNAAGESCGVFAETASESMSYAGSYPNTEGSSAACNIGSIISGNIINTGALDIFSNTGLRPRSHKNIERIDLIIDSGIQAEDSVSGLFAAGNVVLEKSGNNPLQIAAITSLDAEGNPLSYGPLVYIHPANSGPSQLRYGITPIFLQLDFLGTTQGEHDRPLSYANSSQESLGMVFISQADMGLHPGQTYFGVSAFPSDVNGTEHQLTNVDTFPKNSSDTDTSGPGDADFFVAFAAPQKAENTPPQANDDEATTAPNIAVNIPVLENDEDADGDKLTITSIGTPESGRVTHHGDTLIYHADDQFDGSDSFTYQISDGKGGSSEAVVTISAIPVVKNEKVLAAIETGLKGHGAGSLNMFFILTLSLMGLWRIRQFRSVNLARQN